MTTAKVNFKLSNSHSCRVRPVVSYRHGFSTGYLKTLAEMGYEERAVTQTQYESQHIHATHSYSSYCVPICILAIPYYPDRFDQLCSIGRPTYIIVIEDESTQTIVACETVTIRSSMLYKNGRQCSLSDLAVLMEYRGMYLGKL